MGDYAECRGHFNSQVSDGKAHLESDKISFRGDFRITLPFKEMTSVISKLGSLIIVSPQGMVTLELGMQADKWAKKIQNPKSLLDKLGIKPGQKITALGIEDEAFLAELAEKTGQPPKSRVTKDSDLIFFSVNDVESLQRVHALKNSIKRDGGIWVIIPKGQKHIKESDVFKIGRESGLVDVKVVSFSPTHTANKLVIPVADR